MEMGTRELMARRAAQELSRGNLVNLGIGIPTLVAEFIDPALNIVLHSENGFTGLGPAPKKGSEEPDLTNAGGFPVTMLPGGAYFDSLVSFAIVRGGKLDVTILGGLEVNQRGDLANWIVPGKIVPGMGGGMDLALKARKTIVIMTHCTKDGEPKILKECSLPLTARECVNMIITDLAVIEVTPDGLVLREVAQSISPEEVIRKTQAPLKVTEPLGIMEGM